MSNKASSDALGDARGSSAQLYFSGSVGVLFSRVAGMIAGVASLWLLTRILSTEAFAAYSFAMSLVFVLGFATVFGLERVMLLKLSPLEPEPGVLKGALLARRIALWVLVLSCGTAALMFAAFHIFPVLSANRDLVGWFSALVPIVPAVALTAVLIAWLQSNHIVGRPQAVHGYVDVLRCLGLAMVFFVGGGGWAVAFAAVIASVIPPLLLAKRVVKASIPQPANFSFSDAADGLQFFAMRLATIGFLHADILIMGVLAPPAVVAPYVVASRLALILEAGQQVFAPAYAPRVRRHIEGGTPELAAREYGVARTLAFFATSGAALVLLLFGEALLGFFGAFQAAYGVLLVMCMGQLILVGAGLHSIHLSMSDHLPIAAATQVGGLLLYLALLVFLIPAYGAMGAAVAFVIAQAVVAGVGLATLFQRCRISPFQTVPLICYFLAVSGIGIAGFWPEYRWEGGMLLLASLCITAYHARTLLGSVVIDGMGHIARLR